MSEPKKIDGYRTLSNGEIEAINGFKRVEATVNSMIDMLKMTPADERSLALAATHLEIGFMFVAKAIARPDRLTDPEFDALTAKAADQFQTEEEGNANA